jgi:hypothetical protein
MRDLNARAVNNSKNWLGIVERHGFGDEAHDPRKNDDGMRLLDFCSERGLSVTGTFFPHKNIHKYTRYQRGTDFRSQIDYIMVRKTWFSAVHNTRMYRRAEFSNSDHRLVVSEMKLHLSTQKKLTKTRIDLENFKSAEKQTEFQLLLENRFRHV